MKLAEWLSVILSGCTLVTIIIMFYRTFRDPDVKAEKDIGLLKQGCLLRHQGLDKDIAMINENLKLLKVNHINHMETDLKLLGEQQIKIFTILEERLPKRNA